MYHYFHLLLTQFEGLVSHPLQLALKEKRTILLHLAPIQLGCYGNQMLT